jgi:RimJ/RimL family protein N-acetyltransferase
MSLYFDYQQEYILEDDCVLLRPLTAEDCINLRYFSIHQPDLWPYSLVPMDGEANLKAYIDSAIESRNAKTAYPFIVFDKRTQEYAGSTRFYDIKLPYQTLQLGYTWYGKQFQGTGLNKHCKFLLLQFAFEQINMLCVEFRADANNARSIAAMKSIGCTVEGILRQDVPTSTGGRRDSIVLSILQHEWLNELKSKLQSKLKQ